MVFVFESTVYPGCTEEDCVPVLENLSGLKFREDFKVGYSPERINPGDKVHTLQNVVKVVSGCCNEALEEIAKTYELVVEAGVHRAPSLKVAEAAKIIRFGFNLMLFFSEISAPFIPETTNKIKICFGKSYPENQWPLIETFASIFEKVEIGERVSPVENLFTKIEDDYVLELEKQFAGNNN